MWHVPITDKSFNVILVDNLGMLFYLVITPENHSLLAKVTIAWISHKDINTVDRNLMAVILQTQFLREFSRENGRIRTIQIKPNSAPTGPIGNKPALVQIMICHRRDDKPLSQPVLALFTKVCKHQLASVS